MTGFRCATTTSADATGNLIPSGTYPVNSVEAQVLGSSPLDPEESQSFTVGVVWQAADNVSVTFDYYDISIEDRLALLGFSQGCMMALHVGLRRTTPLAGIIGFSDISVTTATFSSAVRLGIRL